VTGLTDRLTDQAAALSNFVTADRRLRREITAFADQMDRLRRGMENETDPHRIQAAAEGMALLLDRLRKTLE
jgi:molecular chaperone GrpE (heat shock protein)